MSPVELESYLRQLAEYHERVRPGLGLAPETVERFVLTHGRFYKGRRDVTVPRAYSRQHECFSNCIQLSRTRPDLTYVEGFAVRVINFHHAWLVDKDGNVIDPALQVQDYGLGSLYFGVPFGRGYVHRRWEAMLVAGGWVGSLLTLGDDDGRLLRGEEADWHADRLCEAGAA
jgi:hypothetical protein